MANLTVDMPTTPRDTTLKTGDSARCVLAETVCVEPLTSMLFDRWSVYLANHPEGTFFHSLIWRDAVSDAFGHEPYYLIALRGNKPVGVLPLFLVRSFLAGRMLVSVPYAVGGGILADDCEAANALFARAKDLAHEYGVGYLDLRSAKAMVDELPVNDRYVTFSKTLPDDPDAVLGTLPRKARAAARQAQEKYNLTVEFDDGHLETVWQLYSRSMRRLGSPNYPYAFFDRLVEYSPGQHLVQILRYEGKPVAGLLSFVHGQTVLPYFNGCDERYNYTGINNHIYMTLMEEAVRMGLRRFDFGRTRKDNTGVVKFKRNQGFEEQPLEYQAYVPAGSEDPQLSPDRMRYRLAGKVWQRLPLAVTRPLGAWLSKSIPG